MNAGTFLCYRFSKQLNRLSHVCMCAVERNYNLDWTCKLVFVVDMVETPRFRSGCIYVY